jgi:hypothetical protein
MRALICRWKRRGVLQINRMMKNVPASRQRYEYAV